MDVERVLAHLRGKRDAMRDLLDALVRAESPSARPDAQAGPLGLLSAALRERGFRTRKLAGESSGGALLATPRERVKGRPLQLLLCHADTVWPVGELESMPAHVDGERYLGPGAYDAKAGLVQATFALDALATLAMEGITPPVTPILFVNTDEEIGSRDSTPWIRRLARRVERVFVLEPSHGLAGDLKTARKGVGRFTITVVGRAAHAGLDPEKGISAILELSHVIQELFALNDPEGGTSVNVGTIDGGLQPNVVAPESRAVVDVRVPTAEDARRLEERIFGLRPSTPGTTLSIEGGIRRPPMERTPGNAHLFALARRAAERLGIPLQESAVGGGSDGNTTSQHAPTLDGLGAVGDGAHAKHEFVYLDKMVERAALLTMLLCEPPLESPDAPREREEAPPCPTRCSSAP